MAFAFALATALAACLALGGCGRPEPKARPEETRGEFADERADETRGERADELGSAAPPPHGQGRGRRPAAKAAPAPRPSAPRERFWELAELPKVAPLRVIELPTRLDVPRFEVAGPVLIDDAARGDSADLAVVASSQLGFAAVDWRRGKVAWTRATGAHVAPPLVLPDGDLVLLSDCALPPDTDEPVLGCARVVTAAGADRSDGAIVGSAALAAAMRDPGPQRTWSLPDHRVAWQRGATALTLDLASGRARQGADAPAPLTVRHRDLELDITLDEDGQLRAHRRGGARALQWQAPGRFAAILGVIPGLGHETPMLRVVRPSIVRSVGTTAAGTSFDILDVDALTASGSQAAVPAPGIQLLASATGARNAAALVVRLDRSLRRDYVIAYTGGARVAWVYPLPDALRSDAVGVAVEKDAVLVFHDGDTLTVLPPIE